LRLAGRVISKRGQHSPSFPEGISGLFLVCRKSEREKEFKAGKGWGKSRCRGGKLRPRASQPRENNTTERIKELGTGFNHVSGWMILSGKKAKIE